MKKTLPSLAAVALLTIGLAGCSGAAEPAAPAAPAEAPAEEVVAEPIWTPVATITGNADQQSDTIALTGGKVRVTYDFVDNAGANMVVGAVYVLTEDTDIMTDGAIPDVMISEPGAGETILRKDAGDYYVKVTAANADYTVTVEEQK
ncbi:hypothetical protein H490_0112435 [Leucobacter sp. UCD-THU]|uniref:hypothetical protein n=1 Tax=Leucobacter sp. UCD-THU TaxID=1292023 RepID=UPI000361E348|nr:hypothetical protein [Leucobacter sp. UCD-THU]EYT52756.1 hypothetical protein H490_0112435 [Leucobacter sp. UCD-THU]